MLNFETCQSCRIRHNGEKEITVLKYDSPEKDYLEFNWGITPPQIEVHFVHSCRLGDWKRGITTCPQSLVAQYMIQMNSDMLNRIALSGSFSRKELEYIEEIFFVGSEHVSTRLDQNVFGDPPQWCSQYNK